MITTAGMLGTTAEKQAIKYLKKGGISIISTNYHCRFGEIDIVAQDEDSLIFVEVRYRKSDHFGGALESIDQHKQKKLRLTAQHYLTQFNKHHLPCRFDILCLQGNIKSSTFHWVKNAF